MTEPRRIEDSEDARLEPFRDVTDPSLVRARGLFVAEGRRVVGEVIRRWPHRLRAVLVTPAAQRGLADALARVPESVPVWSLGSPAALRSLTGRRFHQGCLALAALPPPGDLDAALEARAPGARLVVVLEGVTDPDNVGTIFRTAAAFGARAVLLGPGCAHPLYRKALRTSLGAAIRLPFVEAASWPRDLDALRAAGLRLVALAPDGATPIQEVPSAPRLALLLGSEEKGLSDEARAACDLSARIPTTDAVDSLNVAAAAAIALHRLAPPVP